MTYKVLASDAVIRISDGALVRLHPDSPYYAEYQEWLAQGNTPEEADNPYDPAVGVRAKRDTLLSQSDWTQMPDAATSNAEAWRQYRQALRDIPSQPGFPGQVDWPVPPTP